MDEDEKLDKAQQTKRNALGVRLAKYGLTLAGYDILLVRQGGCCGICLRSFSWKTVPCVDHDHRTGKVRGLLCPSCNYTLGLFHDSEVRFRAMADYLLFPPAAVLDAVRTPPTGRQAKVRDDDTEGDTCS